MGAEMSVNLPGAYQGQLCNKKVDTWKNVHFVDGKRAGKKVNFLVRAPKPHPEHGKKKMPVVIISHVTLGGENCYERLSQYLAAYGYIVVHPVHVDNIKVQRAKHGFGFLMKQGGAKVVLQHLTEKPSVWQDRAADISVIIDQIKALPTKCKSLAGRLGAQTAMLAAGIGVKLPDSVLNGPYTPKEVQDGLPKLYAWHEPRLSCVVAISPQGPGEMGLVDESFRLAKMPIMYISGNNDVSLGKKHLATWKAQPFELAADDNVAKYLAWFYRADNGFGDLAGSKIVTTAAGWKTDADLVALTAMTTRVFLDKVLLQKAAAAKWLDTHAASDCLDSVGYLLKKGLGEAARAAQPQAAHPSPQPAAYPSQYHSGAAQPQAYASGQLPPQPYGQPQQQATYPPQAHPAYQQPPPPYQPPQQSPYASQTAPPAAYASQGQAPPYATPVQYASQHGAYPPQGHPQQQHPNAHPSYQQPQSGQYPPQQQQGYPQQQQQQQQQQQAYASQQYASGYGQPQGQPQQAVGYPPQAYPPQGQPGPYPPQGQPQQYPPPGQQYASQPYGQQPPAHYAAAYPPGGPNYPGQQPPQGYAQPPQQQQQMVQQQQQQQQQQTAQQQQQQMPASPASPAVPASGQPEQETQPPSPPTATEAPTEAGAPAPASDASAAPPSASPPPPAAAAAAARRYELVEDGQRPPTQEVDSQQVVPSAAAVRVDQMPVSVLPQ